MAICSLGTRALGFRGLSRFNLVDLATPSSCNPCGLTRIFCALQYLAELGLGAPESAHQFIGYAFILLGRGLLVMQSSAPLIAHLS